ncbi:hypothetical protein [Micromonospora sp. NPDC005324]|uniref:hypothetical protein n=1 Tax=Micromonospora sp. NPDC005324 TaxID=3157033 RepID=UPI0033A1785D
MVFGTPVPRPTPFHPSRSTRPAPPVPLHLHRADVRRGCGPYVYRATISSSAGDDGNRNQVLFNYADPDNTYVVDLGGGPAATVRLLKRVGGGDCPWPKIRYRGKWQPGKPLTTLTPHERDLW